MRRAPSEPLAEERQRLDVPLDGDLERVARHRVDAEPLWCRGGRRRSPGPPTRPWRPREQAGCEPRAVVTDHLIARDEADDIPRVEASDDLVAGLDAHRRAGEALEPQLSGEDRELRILQVWPQTWSCEANRRHPPCDAGRRQSGFHARPVESLGLHDELAIIPKSGGVEDVALPGTRARPPGALII
jgi:hypothetical protein